MTAGASRLFRLEALVALRRLQAGSAFRALRRERSAWVVLPVAMAVVVLTARRLHALEPPDPGLALGMEVGAGAALAWAAVRGIARTDAGRTAEGPLGDQIVGGRREAVWLCAQAAALLLPVLLLAAAGVAVGWPAAGLRLALAGTAGCVLVAAGVVRGGGRPHDRLPPHRAGGRSPRPGARFLTAAAVLALGTLAAAAARSNNADPTPAAAVLGVCGLVTGAGLGVDLPLLRFLGHEPSSLTALLARFAGLPAVATAAGVGLAGAIVGLSASTVGALSAATALVVAAYAGATALHALGGSGRFAAVAAGVDLALLGAVAAVAAPLALVWAITRAALLVVSARRRRWLEC